MSKALSKSLKKVFPSRISDNQTTYVDERFISQCGRLIADVLQTTDVLKLSGMLITIEFQKAFDSVNHKFSTLALKRYGFGKTFIKRMKTLLNNQESCVINGGFTTKNFKLDKGAGQGDPISTYFFILVLKIVFNLIKQNKDIHGLSFFDHTSLYTAYPDDTTLF